VIDAPSSPSVSDRLKPTSQTVNQRINRELITCMGNRNFGHGMTLDDGPSSNHRWLREGQEIDSKPSKHSEPLAKPHTEKHDVLLLAGNRWLDTGFFDTSFDVLQQ
jgi:hypothetical protein